jgi:hypothetical protein
VAPAADALFLVPTLLGPAAPVKKSLDLVAEQAKIKRLKAVTSEARKHTRPINVALVV